ncbi:MAG: NAD-dependent epimerase/dehydratase family protein [Vicinamibacterales bacterium]
MKSLAGTPVLVVGGLGFIGVNLTAHLARVGARCTVLTPSLERHAETARRFTSQGVHLVEGDSRDQVLVGQLVRGQVVVFNLAGQSGAVRSMEDPWTDLDVNCRGTLVLLEALRAENPSAKFICAGSRLEYGMPARLPVTEDDLGDPLCLHAIHKRTVEQYLELYRKLFGLRYAVARVTNPYGPGQPKGRSAYGVVNRLIHLALADEALTIYGDGAQLRDYIHVDDVVLALVAMAESSAADGRAFNVGSGSGTRMVDLADSIVAIAGGGRVTHVEWPTLAAQIETGDFVADISRIRRELGWVPAIELHDGLARTVSAYRAGADS